MTQLICLLSTSLIAGLLNAQELNVIKLDAPDKTGGTPLMKAFNARKSEREFAPDKLKPKELSTLLWAANGINRPDGKRTAPSAMNAQAVDIYVIMEEGAYLYDAKAHALNPIVAGDYRAAVAAVQASIGNAPVCLVLVSDLSRLSTQPDESTRLAAAANAGIVSQNVNLACAGLGLATVPRTTMDKDTLKKVLKLNDMQLIILNNSVGYPRK